jgi:multiple sugar transport system substrate-binding protein
MARHAWFVLLATMALVVAACAGPGASSAPTGATSTGGAPTAAATSGGAETPEATSGGEESPEATSEASPGEESPEATSEASPGEESPGTGESPSAGGSFDPSTISGTVNLGQWESSPAEKDALDAAVSQFESAYPNIDVQQETVAGDYRAEMITRFGAHNAPDLFYVNAEYAQDWINAGFLMPLDDYIAAQGFDTSAFIPEYLEIFTGEDGHIYGLPKDGNTIAMAYNSDMVTTPPATLDDLVSTATDLKDAGTVATPMCLSAGLDRALGFIYAQGGSLLTEDGSAENITSDESKAAVQWYLDLFKNGLGTVAPTGSWCGQELGTGNVAMAFEGGWLVGYMNESAPDTPYAFAEMPVGSSGEPVTLSYTAAYGIAADAANPDQAWATMQWLTGPEGMEAWTSGGIAVPSRTDVPVPEGFETIVAGAEYSRPGSGFMTGYNDVQTAFTNAMTVEIQNGTYSADAVVTATADAITAAMAQ